MCLFFFKYKILVNGNLLQYKKNKTYTVWDMRLLENNQVRDRISMIPRVLFLIVYNQDLLILMTFSMTFTLSSHPLSLTQSYYSLYIFYISLYLSCSFFSLLCFTNTQLWILLFLNFFFNSFSSLYFISVLWDRVSWSLVSWHLNPYIYKCKFFMHPSAKKWHKINQIV